MTKARSAGLGHERRGHHLRGAGGGDRAGSTPPPPPRACPANPDGLDEDLLQVLLHVDNESEQIAPGRHREVGDDRSEEHTSELQSLAYLVCRLLLEKKKREPREIRGTTHSCYTRPY